MPAAIALLLIAGQSAAMAQNAAKTTKPLTETELQTEIYFSDGNRYSLLEQWDKALDSYRRAIDLDPGNAAIHYKTAEALSHMNRLPEASDEAEKAMNLGPKQAYYYVLYAGILERRGEYSQASKVYKRLIDKVPGSDDYYFPLANVYLMQGKLNDAIKVLDRIEKTFGKNPDVTRQKQQIWLKMNKLDKAIAEGRSLMEAYPDEPGYSVVLAELLWNNKRPDEATQILKSATEKNPENGYARMLLYEIYKSQGKENEANKEIEPAFRNPEIRIDEKIRILATFLKGFQNKEEEQRVFLWSKILTEVHPEEYRSWAMYGDFSNITGQKQQARTYYLKSADLPGAPLGVWEQILKIDIDLNETDSMLKHTDRALESFPTQGVFWFYNGRSFLVKKDYVRASASMEQARKFSASNPEILLEVNAMLGDCYYQLKQYEKSDEAYEAALKLDPKNDYVLNNFSYYLSLRREKLDKAKTMSAKLVELNPDQANYLDTYGWVLYTRGEYKDAKNLLEKAAQLSGSGTVIEHYGDALFRVGEKEKAYQQWKKAKEAGGEENPEQLDKKIATRSLPE
ncbi:MAG: tetratricopeptide repeat protein [Bacteroidota bacterium]